MACPYSRADFTGTAGTWKQHSIRVIFGLQELSEAVFPWFPGECMSLCRMLRAFLLIWFMGAMKGLQLRMNVILDELLNEWRTLTVNLHSRTGELQSRLWSQDGLAWRRAVAWLTRMMRCKESSWEGLKIQWMDRCWSRDVALWPWLEPFVF